MRTLLLVLLIATFPAAASGQTPKRPPQVAVQPRTPLAVEDATTNAMMKGSKSAQDDLRHLMDAVKGARASAQQVRAGLPPAADAISSTSSLSRAAVANPCEAQDAASWRICLDRVREKLAGVRMEAADKADLNLQADQLKQDIDSLSEMGEMESLRLQMAMDRMSKMMSTLSNILKKTSDTSSAITQNIK